MHASNSVRPLGDVDSKRGTDYRTARPLGDVDSKRGTDYPPGRPLCRWVVNRGVPGINNVIIGAVPVPCETAPQGLAIPFCAGSCLIRALSLQSARLASQIKWGQGLRWGSWFLIITAQCPLIEGGRAAGPPAESRVEMAPSCGPTPGGGGRGQTGRKSEASVLLRWRNVVGLSSLQPVLNVPRLPKAPQEAASPDNCLGPLADLDRHIPCRTLSVKRSVPGHLHGAR